MQKILSTDQIREADKVTIQREPIASIDLMERAANACVEWFEERFDQARPVIVMAGIGNNGGDALVMARRLGERGFQVETFVVRFSESFSEDMQVNLDRLTDAGQAVHYILEESQFPSIPSNAVIIDGLFGSGLNRKAEGLAALCIEQINASIAEVVSIDMPSGLYADKWTPSDASVITASYTLTFQVPKLAFFLPENEEFVGEWNIIDIGLDAGYLADAKVGHYLMDSVDGLMQSLRRRQFDHKGRFGHGLLIAGSVGMMGAAIMSSRAALRSGIGKLTVHVPEMGYEILQSTVPEAMCSVDEFEAFIGALPGLRPYSVIGCGPGIGTDKKTRRMLKALLQQSTVPMVLDADALNLLAANTNYLKELPAHTVLTPHVGEFERLFGKSKHSFERLSLLKESAKKWKCIIVLKGAHTAIASPDGTVYFNTTGNPGMATAGSGDVLTGIITSFLAQFNDPLMAVICAVYVHGRAGDLAARERGQIGLVASDLIDACGRAIQESF